MQIGNVTKDWRWDKYLLLPATHQIFRMGGTHITGGDCSRCYDRIHGDKRKQSKPHRPTKRKSHSNYPHSRYDMGLRHSDILAPSIPPDVHATQADNITGALHLADDPWPSTPFRDASNRKIQLTIRYRTQNFGATVQFGRWHSYYRATAMKRVSKAQWLEKALDVLETDGVTGVRVEVLAKHLGISKSGFYWHFKDRDELLRQVLEYWAEELTKVASSNEALQKAKPKSRLIELAIMILDYDLARYEIPIRQWALQDMVAASAVKKVNRLRLDFVRQAFSELGFKGEDLEMRTMLFVCYHTWESPMFQEISKKKRRRLIAKRIDFLTRK